ncbi:hypothetical protein BDV30DRAFT_42448 [Aspergillus minisclerotigenes]|uniref:Uncharacterized protein n=1 Tax=Aspergillus minisclerotigenes TaxID=656917 RepID=A0A5N6IMG8_9EURO|nr:hypothetical protein BDV30DRAFT_42448 [Aspergillus minisclerotigenes]
MDCLSSLFPHHNSKARLTFRSVRPGSLLRPLRFFSRIDYCPFKLTLDCYHQFCLIKTASSLITIVTSQVSRPLESSKSRFLAALLAVANQNICRFCRNIRVEPKRQTIVRRKTAIITDHCCLVFSSRYSFRAFSSPYCFYLASRHRLPRPRGEAKTLYY